MMYRHLAFWAAILLAATLPLPAAAQDEEPGAEDAASEEEERDSPAYTEYVEMTPSFVTHVGEPAERLNYLKAEVSLRVGSETAREAIETHMPRLRHELVMLFGEQTDLEILSSSDGQQDLRQVARERMNQVLDEQRTGETITDVLFTSFVIQR